jgi:hypothetical protein
VSKLALLCLVAQGGGLAADSQVPERVRDLKYGPVLYEYHQGNIFEALTLMGVAGARGGIGGHGDHPLVIEGSLMLAYGMNRDAKIRFERVLADQVSPEARNQAWFYLGKVLYLENDAAGANASFERVDAVALAETSPELYREWLYLKGQLALRAGDTAAVADILATLAPEGSLWHAYLSYNLAVEDLTGTGPGAAIERLNDLAGGLAETRYSKDDRAEAAALRERTLLTLGRLHLARGQYADALASLQRTRLRSVFSEQALFQLAVAASRLENYGIALQALDTLQKRELFSSRVQQAPYARGFVFEEMGREQSALEAYQDAASHYQALRKRLAEERSALSEDRIIAALGFIDRERFQAAGLQKDAYGRLDVEPEVFSLARLLSSEEFQLSLKNLHELYRLRFSLDRWQRQLDSFDAMLATRAHQRDRKIRQTRAALAHQDSGKWRKQQQVFRQQIDQAEAQDDFGFFMDNEHKAFQAMVDGMNATLAGMPASETTTRYRQKVERVQAFLDWRLADSFAVNRWQTRKQMLALDEAMSELTRREARIRQQMDSEDRTRALVSRVSEGRSRLSELGTELETTLPRARQALMAQVNAELKRQENIARYYLREARHAQARLSDALFRQGDERRQQAPAQTGEPR